MVKVITSGNSTVGTHIYYYRGALSAILAQCVISLPDPMCTLLCGQGLIVRAMGHSIKASPSSKHTLVSQ